MPCSTSLLLRHPWLVYIIFILIHITMYYPDAAIKVDHHDLLWRDKFIHSLKNLIISYHDDEEALVIGLDWKRWEWKTSLLNLLSSALRKENDILVRHFDPRLYNKELDIQEKFFDEFAWNLSLQSKTKLNDQKNAFLDYTESILQSANSQYKLNFLAYSLFIVIPFLWSIVSSLLGPDVLWIRTYGLYLVIVIILFMIIWRPLLLFLVQRTKRLSLKNRVSTEEQFQRIKCELAKAKIKQVIIIDDIDRLNINQVDSIMQIVKSSGNFPNTVYILSFDKSVITSMLAQKYWRDNQYLEKIIQLETPLPQLSYQKYHQVFNMYFDEFLRNLVQGWHLAEHLNDDEKRELVRTYRAGMYRSFNNIRSIKRYFNLLYRNIYTIQYWCIMNEIYLHDFMLLEYFKIYVPRLYHRIHEHRSVFFQRTSIRDLNVEIETRLKDLDLSQHLWLMMRLFPDPTTLTSHQYHTRLCVEKNFDNYFALNVIWLSNSDFDSLCQFITANNIDWAKDALSVIIEKWFWVELYQRFNHVLYSDRHDIVYIDKDTIVKYNIFLINHVEQITFQPTGIFDTMSGPDMQLSWIVYHSLIRLSSSIQDYYDAVHQIIDWVESYYPVFHHFYTYFGVSDNIESETTEYAKQIIEKWWQDEMNKVMYRIFVIHKELFTSNNIFQQYNRKKMYYYMKVYHKDSFNTHDWVQSLEWDYKKIFIDSFFVNIPSQWIPIVWWDLWRLEINIKFKLEDLLDCYTLQEIKELIATYYPNESEYYIVAKHALDQHAEISSSNPWNAVASLWTT